MREPGHNPGSAERREKTMTKTEIYTAEQKLDTEALAKIIAEMTPEQKQIVGGLILGVQLAGQMNSKEKGA